MSNTVNPIHSSIRKSRPVSRLAVILLTCVAVPCAKADGLAAIKDQTFHADSSAKPFVFSKIRLGDGPLVQFTKGGKDVLVEKAKVVDYVELPAAYPISIPDESEAEALRKCFAEIKRFGTRFPHLAPMLAAHHKKLEEIVSNLDSGKILVEGKWTVPKAVAGSGSADGGKKASPADEPAAAGGVVLEGKRTFPKLLSFSDVTITKVEKDAIRITHRAGVRRIPIEQIPRELRDELGISLEDAAEYRKELARRAKLEGSRRRFSAATIFQVVEEGVLLRVNEGLVFVRCKNHGFVDGGSFSADAWADGTHTYTAITGARTTVSKYTTYPEDITDP